ncbi:hypothetical protein [Flavobacterium sp. JP2137]|uniref:hypothetical protein n=1 Tax=Flavobacterium sp. JP2137 TaxID=3414510 RepID=UPI003D2FBFCC
MRKIGLFLAGIAVSVLAASCGVSDEGNYDLSSNASRLELTAVPDKELAVGGIFVFMVRRNGREVTPRAQIYVGGKRIQGNTYSRTTAGTHTVVAKAIGSRSSKPLMVTFTDKTPLGNQLFLTCDAGENPQYGQEITYTVKNAAGDDVTSSSVLRINGARIRGNKIILKKRHTTATAVYCGNGTLGISSDITTNFDSNYIEIDGEKFGTTQLRFVYSNTEQMAGKWVDFWNVYTQNEQADSQAIPTQMKLYMGFVRTDPQKMAYPAASTQNAALYADFVLDKEVIQEYSTAATFSIIDFKRKVTERGNEYSDERTAVVFDYTLRDGRQIKGMHLGQASIEQNAAGPRAMAVAQPKTRRTLSKFRIRK